MKIDFHILDNATWEQAALYTCELVETCHARQQTVYIHTSSQAEAEKLDTLLWTYRDDSFLPHGIFTSSDTQPPPILIGYQETAPKHHVLINFSTQKPGFYPQFQHLIEIVFSDPTMQQLARERFRDYRDQQHEINTIKVPAR